CIFTQRVSARSFLPPAPGPSVDGPAAATSSPVPDASPSSPPTRDPHTAGHASRSAGSPATPIPFAARLPGSPIHPDTAPARHSANRNLPPHEPAPTGSPTASPPPAP